MAYKFLEQNSEHLSICEKNSFKQTFKKIAFKSFYGYNSSNIKNNFNKRKWQAINSLSKDKNIIILKSDKSNQVVILDRDEYNKKLETIILDTSKFQKIDKDIVKYTRIEENRVSAILRQLKNSNIINSELFDKLNPTGTQPGRLYGLPKTHKPNIPLRPIFSAINTSTYKISKFLVPLLQPLTQNNYTIKDTPDFLDKLKQYNHSNGEIMVSFDIESLFTNIPLEETVEICIQQIFNNKPNDYKFNGFSKEVFRKILNLSVKNNFFLCNQNLYKQIDGVAMGNPLAPILANIFLNHQEKKWLNHCPQSYKPQLYLRYVDDTFLIFKQNKHIEHFLTYLNNQHKNIKFTKQNEDNGTLNFLDVNVKNNHNEFQTSCYRKPTFSGLYTQFSSFMPSLYKINLIKTLIHRIYVISSSYKIFHMEITKFKEILQKNGFPSNLISKEVKKYLNKIYNPKEKILTCKKKSFTFSLTYLGDNQIIKELNFIFKKYFPHLEIRIVFIPKLRLGSFFKNKDPIPSALVSQVVYKFTCSSCTASYIGETRRHLGARIGEHLGISFLTGKPKVGDCNSAIYKHIKSLNHVATENNFKILTKCKNNEELIIKESFYIKNFLPNLNNNIYSYQIKLF